jgi:hypothetical protein
MRQTRPAFDSNADRHTHHLVQSRNAAVSEALLCRRGKLMPTL